MAGWKRKRALIYLGIAGVVVGCLIIGLTTRKKSAYQDLYDLHPAIGERVDSSGVIDTVFVFRQTAAEQAKDALRRYFRPAPHSGRHSLLPADNLDLAVTIERGSPPVTEMRGFTNGGIHVTCCTGTIAASVASEANLGVPSNGLVVTISEKPDWFTVKVNSALSFLRLK